jgi:hypothetical protein
MRTIRASFRIAGVVHFCCAIDGQVTHGFVAIEASMRSV